MKRYNNLIGTILALIPLNSTIISKIPIISTPLGIAVAWTDKAKAEDAQFYFDRAFDKGEKGDHYGAISDFKKAIKINPKYDIAYNNRGIVRKNLGDYEGAILDINYIVNINPKDLKAIISRGQIKSKPISQCLLFLISLNSVDHANSDFFN